MKEKADVRSLEQLDSLLENAQRFRNHLLKELENLQVELRRLTSWIEVEAAEYWHQQMVQAQRQYSEAQDTLSRCMSYVRETERRPCTEEKKRLKIAEERKALCEEKLKTLRAAATAWERHRRKNHGKIQRCHDLADSDLVVANQYLQTQIEHLRAYAGLRSAAVSPRSGSNAQQETRDFVEPKPETTQEGSG